MDTENVEETGEAQAEGRPATAGSPAPGDWHLIEVKDEVGFDRMTERRSVSVLGFPLFVLERERFD